MFSLFRKKPVFNSDINGPITLTKRYGEQAVLTGNITQSGGELVRMWEKLLGSEALKKTQVKSALLLGVGGGMILRLIHKHFPDAKLTGVELDPVMIKIAKEYFDLAHGLEVKMYERDANTWVKKRKEKFDLIVVDLYIKEFNAPGTRDESFLLDLKDLLSPKGIIFYNSHFQNKKPEEYKSFVSRCSKIFKVQEVYSEYPLNRVLRLMKK